MTTHHLAAYAAVLRGVHPEPLTITTCRARLANAGRLMPSRRLCLALLDQLADCGWLTVDDELYRWSSATVPELDPAIDALPRGEEPLLGLLTPVEPVPCDRTTILTTLGTIYEARLPLAAVMRDWLCPLEEVRVTLREQLLAVRAPQPNLLLPDDVALRQALDRVAAVTSIWRDPSSTDRWVLPLDLNRSPRRPFPPHVLAWLQAVLPRRREGLTLQQLADAWGTNKARVGQIEQVARRCGFGSLHEAD